MQDPELSLSVGLDFETWLKEGLVDILAEGHGPLQQTVPQKPMIDLAHAYGVLIYPLGAIRHQLHEDDQLH